MPEPKPKLPRSVIVLNIIMIILVLAICVLTVSLLYSDAVRGEQETSADISVSNSAGGSSGSATTPVSTTTTPKSSVSMTKRSTEATEYVTTPVDAETEESGGTYSEEPDINYYPDGNGPDTYYYSYDQEFFSDDLFIGDSITTGLYLYNKLDMKNVAAKVSYTPYKAYTDPVDLYDGTSSTALEYAERMQPNRIYIMLGSNGLLSASAMEDSYRLLLSKLRTACPDSELYCISVSPITSDSSLAATGGITNDMVVQFNSFIEDVCAEERIGYIDFYSQITDENGFFLLEYAEADGLHFKGITYDVMLSYIQSCLS